MAKYQLGKDTNGKPFEEETFYIHIRTGAVIKLYRDAAGFRVEYGEYGEKSDIFILNKGWEYRPMTEKDFEDTINNSQKRKSWLEGGLAALTKSAKQPATQQPTTQQTPRRTDAMDGEF